MSVVLGVNLISRRRSRRNTADAGLPPSSLHNNIISNIIWGGGYPGGGILGGNCPGGGGDVRGEMP